MGAIVKYITVGAILILLVIEYRLISNVKELKAELKTCKSLRAKEHFECKHKQELERIKNEEYNITVESDGVISF